MYFLWLRRCISKLGQSRDDLTSYIPAWTASQDVDMGNGMTFVQPGSHRERLFGGDGFVEGVEFAG